MLVLFKCMFIIAAIQNNEKYCDIYFDGALGALLCLVCCDQGSTARLLAWQQQQLLLSPLHVLLKPCLWLPQCSLLAKAFIVSASRTAVFSKMSEGVHRNILWMNNESASVWGERHHPIWPHYIHNSFILTAVVNYIPMGMTLKSILILYLSLLLCK